MVNVSLQFIKLGAPSNQGGIHINLFHPWSLACTEHSFCWVINSDIWLYYYSSIKKNKKSQWSLTWLCSGGSLLLRLVLVKIVLVCLSVNRLFCYFYTCTCTAGNFLNDFWKPGCFQSAYSPQSCYFTQSGFKCCKWRWRCLVWRSPLITHRCVPGHLLVKSH